MKIANREISAHAEPFIIAEAGLNHNGSISRAFDMIKAAADAGMDVVKFQTFKADEFCHPDDPLYKWFKASELPESVWPEIKACCDEHNVIFMSTPQNRSDLDILLKVGVPAVKVGSDDFANLPLISSYGREGLPLILSMGMSDLEDIRRAREVVDPDNTAFLLCTSQYPTRDPEARMSRLPTLADAVRPSLVGFSDHTLGVTAAAMAVAYGACIFEKHFTLDQKLEGPDHEWACTPKMLREWNDAIRSAWRLRGDAGLTLTPTEAEQKRKYQRKAGSKIRGVAGCK